MPSDNGDKAMQNARLILSAGLALATHAAAGQTLTTLYTFTGGADGGNPIAGLVAGPDGSFYGTTSAAAGTVFQISPPAKGQTAWQFTTLYSFTGEGDGAFPENLIMDKAGSLYGMTNQGGIFNGTCAYDGTDYGCGTVFKLSPPAQRQTGWALTTLYAFPGGSESSSPTGGVVMDGSGDLFGFTAGLYTCGNMPAICGSAYELAPPAAGQTAWTETTLYTFKGGRDGAYAGYFGSPLLGPGGTLSGIAAAGGDLKNPNCAPIGGCGLVFQLMPPGHAETLWTEERLLVFTGRNGIAPLDGLSADSVGNLYGSTNEGGRLMDCVPGSPYSNGCGVIYQLSPPAPGGAGWTASTLHKFTNGADGGYPYDAPAFLGGRIYVTTSGDEVKSFGTIAALTPTDGGRNHWRVKTLFTFSNDANGCSPTGSLVMRNGTIYGTTDGDGAGPAPYGTLYAFKP
jgi:hypothetical protein